jgi:hypothetical protein
VKPPVGSTVRLSDGREGILEQCGVDDFVAVLLEDTGDGRREVAYRRASVITEVLATPRAWGEGQVPTSQQLADWLGTATAAERLDLVEGWLAFQADVGQCLLRDHQGALDAWWGGAARYWTPWGLTGPHSVSPGPW